MKEWKEWLGSVMCALGWHDWENFNWFVKVYQTADNGEATYVRAWYTQRCSRCCVMKLDER